MYKIFNWTLIITFCFHSYWYLLRFTDIFTVFLHPIEFILWDQVFERIKQKNNSRKHSKQGDPKVVNFYTDTMNSLMKGNKKPTPLYPYQGRTLKVIFFYGDNYKRQKVSTILDNFFSLIFNWFNLGILVGAAVLCTIRRKMALGRNGLISCYIDVLITFIGGGNLQIYKSIVTG